MALPDHTSIGRYGMAAIVAAVLTALAVASPGPAWGQEAGDAAGAAASRWSHGSRRDADDDDGRRW